MSEPIYDDDEKDILGYLIKELGTWKAQTVFGYTIGRAETKNEALTIIKSQGSNYLKGVWQYYDKDDHTWHNCIIKSASKDFVTINRTNAMGYQEPDNYKLITLKHPDENTLIKSS